MTEPLRWGLLATGWIAGQLMGDLRVAGIEVVAVGSRTQEGADAFAATWGIPHAHGSYEALVADPDVDVVYVSTPHPMHAANARLALEAGKHVLLEKPFTLNAREAREIADLAAERGLVLQEAMWTRFLPHMVRLREVLAAGTIGELRAVLATHNQRLNPDPQARLQNPDLGGGALLDLGIYPVSFAWEVLGAPSEVLAISTPTATGVDQSTAILLGYGSGAQAVLHTELDVAGPNSATILGTAGRIDIDATFYAPTSFTVIGADGEVLERFDGHIEAGEGRQFQAFATEAAIRAGAGSAPELTTEESVAIMGTLDLVRERIGLRYPTD